MKKQETTKNTTIAMFLPVIAVFITTTLGEDLQSTFYWVKTALIFILMLTSAYFIYRELKAKALKTEETTNPNGSSRNTPTNARKSTTEAKLILGIVAIILTFVFVSAYYISHFGG